MDVNNYIKEWNSNLSNISNKCEEELSDLEYWFKNPQSMLIFNPVKNILEVLVKDKFNYENINLKMVLYDGIYKLEFYIIGEHEPRIVVDLMSKEYEVVTHSFSSEFWFKKLVGHELGYIDEKIEKITDLLNKPFFLRFFYSSLTYYPYGLSKSSLLKYKKEMEDWRNNFDKTRKMYEERRVYMLEIEDTVKQIGDFLNSMMYNRNRNNESYYI